MAANKQTCNNERNQNHTLLKNVPSPLVGKVVVDVVVVVVVEVVVGVVVEVAVVVVAVVVVEVCVVVDAVVDGVEVVVSSHCSRLGCLGPDSLLQCLAPVSRMVQTLSSLL